MKKKVLVLLISIIMSVSLCPQIAAGAENLILNGGFEEGTSRWGTAGSDYISISTDIKHSGNNAVKILSDGNQPWVCYNFYNLQPGATYKASAFIRTELAGDRGFNFKVECYDSSGNALLQGSGTEYKSTTQGQWVEVSADFVVPENTGNLRLYCRLYGAGTAYVDDVSFMQSKGPEPYDIQTSHVFHYTGDSNAGTAKVTLNPYYDMSSDEAKATVNFVLRDGTQTLKEEKNVAFSQREITFRYDVSLLKEKAKRYVLETRIYKPGSVMAVKSLVQGVYLYDRPTRIDTEGNYILNNEIFHPVIGYHVYPEDYAKAKEAGINVVTIGSGNCAILSYPERVTQVLAKLEEYDLYGIFGMDLDMTAASSSSNLENTRALVQELHDNPRVFAWSVQDEPLGSGITTAKLAALESSYHEVRSRDSMHPVYICDYTQSFYSYDMKYCDVFAPDIYTKSKTAIRIATENAVREGKAAGNKPVYTIVQTYKSDAGYLPEADSVRHNVFQTVIGGAQGVGYYSFSDAVTNPRTPMYSLGYWDEIVKLGSELQTLFKTAEGEYTESKTADYIMRTYSGSEHIIVLPLGSCEIPFTDNYLEVIGGDTSLLSQTETGYTLIVCDYKALMLSKVRKIETDVYLKKLGTKTDILSQGVSEVCYDPCNADLYAALYTSAGKIYRVFMARNQKSVSVTVPTMGVYTLRVFVMKPGTLSPLTNVKEF